VAVVVEQTDVVQLGEVELEVMEPLTVVGVDRVQMDEVVVVVLVVTLETVLEVEVDTESLSSVM
jgi:hypothetical protein